MTMDAMVKYLENLDFEVKKLYETAKESYKFVISRNGIEVTGYFKYPKTKDYSIKDKLQHEFIDEIVTKYRKRAEQILDAKEEEKEMKNITWSVSSSIVECEDRFTPPVISANILGYVSGPIDSKIINQPGFLAQILEAKLNDYEKENNMSTNKIAMDFTNHLSDSERNNLEELVSYVKTDLETTNFLCKQFNMPNQTKLSDFIKDVIFNPPATIVFWKDNTKTVVKAQEGETYDPEKGMAMAMCKKMLGNKGNYFNVFSKWTKKYYDDIDFENNIMNKFQEALDNYFSTLKKGIGQFPVIAGDGNPPKKTEENTDELPWKIWYHKFDTYGNIIEFGVHNFEYKYKSSATRKAKKLYDKNNYEWIVSKTNPFINDLSE